MKVLIVEDDQVTRRLLEALLKKWGYEVLSTCEGTEALEELEKPEAPNLVISDWMMPGMDGLELCRKIRKTESSGYIYFIIVTARGEKQCVVEGFEAGADDYLIKPFDREELKCRIQIGKRIIDLEHRLTRLASTDALTGALNRRAFTEKVEIEIHRATRENATFSFLLADIDYFKKVNDTFGHQAGDFVLQKFTERLSSCSRPYDFIGRYGGEEFVMCLPGTDVLQARSIAERLRREVEDMSIQPADVSQSIQITASIGVASFRLASKETVDSITMRADEAMYKAKREGRNRVCVGNNR
ncbi:MAG: diguanylate cyclase response regulator [Desulfobacterales bacterium C00003060]|nr:MAG: diguanylate cyclase response regulator [Desulfobacterales bacterium C00003060]